MSQAPPTPQMTSVTDDRPCATCGYNLRGQAAAWDRATARWRATCPECGSTQAIALDGDVPATAAVRWTTYLAIAAVAGVAWNVATMLAAAVARMMSTPSSSAAGLTAAFAGARGAAPPRAFDADAYVIVAHLAIQSIPLALSAASIGALAWSATFAIGRQRLGLAMAVVGAAWLVGVWANLTNYSFGDSDMGSYVRLVGQLSGAQRGASAEVDWQWKVASAVAALLIAALATRAGLAVGGPIARTLRAMFLPGGARETR